MGFLDLEGRKQSKAAMMAPNGKDISLFRLLVSVSSWQPSGKSVNGVFLKFTHLAVVQMLPLRRFCLRSARLEGMQQCESAALAAARPSLTHSLGHTMDHYFDSSRNDLES